MRFLAAFAFALVCAVTPAAAVPPAQVATVTPAYQAPATYSWTPASLGAALTNRWLASSPASGAVTTWTDTVASLAPTQATGSLQPVQSATSCNGFPGVTFDGVDDQLTVAAVTGLPTGATAGEIAILAIPTLTGGTQAVFSYGGGASNNRLIRKGLTANAAQVNDGTVTLSSDGAFFPGLHTASGSWATTTESGRLDGKPFATPSATISTLATGTTRTRIGSAPNTSAANFFTGVICEIDVTTALGATDEQRMEAYLLYSVHAEALLPYNHPYRFRKP